MSLEKVLIGSLSVRDEHGGEIGHYTIMVPSTEGRAPEVVAGMRAAATMSAIVLAMKDFPEYSHLDIVVGSKED